MQSVTGVKPNATYLDNEFRQVFRNLNATERLRKVDVARWVKYLKDAGAGTVYMDFKTSGYALYDSKLLPKDPVLGQRDLGAELARACRRHGLKYCAYLEPSQFESLARGHDDWQQRTVDGGLEAVNRGSARTVFCWNSGYRDLFAAVLREIARTYRPHGFYIDGIIFGFSACFCATCKALFKEATGHELPLNPDWKSPVWHAYLDWRRGRIEDISRVMGEAVHAVDPRIAVVWNCGYFNKGWYDAQSPAQAQWLDFASVEILPTGSGWRVGDHKYTYGESLVWGTAANRSLKYGKLTNNYTYLVPTTRLAEAVTSYDLMMAAGGTPCPQEHVRFLPQLLRRVRQIEPYLVDMQSAADVALHFSTAAHNAYYQPDDHGRDRPFFAELQGVFKALLNSHVPVEVIHDDWLECGDLTPFRTVILPNSVCLSATAIGRLQSYVESGGTIVATLETGLRDRVGNRQDTELLWPGSGLRFKGDIVTPKPRWWEWQPDGAFRFEDNIPAEPDQYLVFQDSMKGWIGEDIRLGKRPDGVETREGLQFEGVPSCQLPTPAVEVGADRNWKTLLTLRFRRDKQKGWGDGPAVLVRNWGRGRIVYANFQVGTPTSRSGHPWWRRLMARLVEEASGKPKVRVRAPICVKLFVWRQPARNRTLIHLVNELSSAGQREVEREDHIPVPVTVKIALPSVTSVKAALGGRGCTITRAGRGWTVQIPALAERAVLVCEGAR
jgi:uncharacterized lipoprotein YddW (UPF0748 family)